MDAATLASALADGVALLRDLDAADASRADRVAVFERTHAALRPMLLTDHPPGSPRAERDLHFLHPDGGAISLSWREQDGSPWALLYADHWAAQYVFAIDDVPVTIRSALIALRCGVVRGTDVLETLVSQELVDREVRRHPTGVTDDELQAAVNDQRRALHLHDASAFRAWLDASGMTDAEFIEGAEGIVQRRKWAEALTAGVLQERFDASRAGFDRVTILEVTAHSEAAAGRLSVMSHAASPLAALGDHLADVAHARVRRCFGNRVPAPGGSTQLVLQLERTDAVLDDETTDAVREMLVREWLVERRAAVRVRWFWK